MASELRETKNRVLDVILRLLKHKRKDIRQFAGILKDNENELDVIEERIMEETLRSGFKSQCFHIFKCIICFRYHINFLSHILSLPLVKNPGIRNHLYNSYIYPPEQSLISYVYRVLGCMSE